VGISESISSFLFSIKVVLIALQYMEECNAARMENNMSKNCAGIIV